MAALSTSGVTNDLVRRVYEHREKLADGFTKQYDVSRLVYYETHSDVEAAIVREKADEEVESRLENSPD